MKLLLLKCLTVLLMALTIISCQRSSSTNAVSLDDSVKQAIIRYVGENNIDLKTRVITTDWVSNPYRTDVYISNSFHQLIDSPSHMPTYYSVISDSIVVLVYSGVERSIGRDTQRLSDEIRDLLVKKNVKLEPDNGNIIRTRTWLLTVCEGKSELIREPAVSDLFYIPCRNVFLHDTLRNE